MEKPAVSFVNYELEKFSFQRNQTDESEINIEISISTQTTENDIALRKITLNLTITGAVSSEIVIAGIFKKEDYPEDFENTNALHIIGASVLFPYARSILSFISSIDGKKPILLPTINLNNFFEKDPDKNENQDNKK